MDVVKDTGSGPITRPLRRLGKYELIARIAAGGMAEVYLARLRGPMNFQKAVVVKVIHPHLASQEEFLRMLLDEARLSALIKHPRVVDIYELGCEEGVYFIAMEFIAGQPLTAVMGSGIAGQPLDPYSTARVIADAADGLHAAHELKGASGNTLGLVHRDVSPGNIMVLHDGGVKIVDFGIAKARGRLTISGVQQFKGKVGYVAPEQLSGGVVDRRTDVFGLGVVMWEALALQRLFRMEDEKECLRAILSGEPATPSAIRPEVPVELSAICLKALAPFPDYRFQTAGEMRDAIESFLIRVGYFREAGAIKNYMEQVFGRQHESRQKTVRRLAAITHTGEMPITVDVTFEDDDDFPDLEVKYSGVPADPSSDLARGTPTDQPERHTGSEEATVPLEALSGPKSRTGPTVAEPRRHTSKRPLSAPRRKKKSGVGRSLLVVILLLAIAGAAAGIVMTALNDSTGSPGSKREAAVEHRSDVAAAEPAAQPEPTEASSREPGQPAVSEPARTSKASKSASSARHKPAPPPAPAEVKEKKSAAQLYEEGADLFVQGKASAAKDRFKEAIAADSHYAPAFRGLGLAYTAEGKREKAKKSFERYLQLRPGASDADAIRKRIEQLGQL
jgi:eukaryotic-like serine/threonine-protein kinase